MRNHAKTESSAEVLLKLFYRMLESLRMAVDSGWCDPITRYGSVYIGWYDLQDWGVSGVVSHYNRVSTRPPYSIIATNGGEVAGSVNEFAPAENTSWRFQIQLAFTPLDILRDRLAVFAVDRLGSRSRLKVLGEAQLIYVRKALGDSQHLPGPS